MSQLSALQAVLAAEHAAVYVYGVLGGQTSQSAQPALFAAVDDAYAAHRARRDRLTQQITDLGADPVAAARARACPAVRLRRPRTPTSHWSTGWAPRSPSWRHWWAP